MRGARVRPAQRRASVCVACAWRELVLCPDPMRLDVEVLTER